MGMGTQSCCCRQNIGQLRDLCLGENNSSSRRRHHLKTGLTTKFAKARNVAAEAGTSSANPRSTCGLLRCRCGLSAADPQGFPNASGGGAGALQYPKVPRGRAGIGMERPLSQPLSQLSGKSRTHSVSLLRDYKTLELSPSPCKDCTGKKTLSGFGVPVSSSNSNCGEEYDEKSINRQSPRMKVSMRTLAIAACFGGIGAVMTVLLSTLPPDFESRWRMLFDDTPPGEGRSPGGPQSPTVLFDCHGVVIATIGPRGCSYKEEDALPRNSGRSETVMRVSPAEITDWMWQAVVASEDRRFFKHQGVDPRSLSRAVLSLATRGGGSTITQQLIKNVFLTNERKWTRKLSEIILALVLEKQMSKWDILHCYLKKVYWGHGVTGIEGAAVLYFGKHPSLLTLGECAMLAGMLPAPELLSPYRDPSRGKRPQGRALRRMVECGFLNTASAVEVLRQPLKLASESNDGTSGPWKAPYFVSQVLSELTQKYGWFKVACGGLQVHTTLDLSMQRVAEKVVLDHLVEYDKERILLADEGLQKTLERLEALQSERQEQVTKVAKGAVRSIEVQSGHFVKRSDGKMLATEAADCETKEEPRDSISSPAATKVADAVTMRFLAAEEYLQAAMSKYQEEIKAAEKSSLQAAMVAIDPLSGAVRVLVGGRDYYESNFNRGTEAFRSAGSILEPVVYLTALEEGLNGDHVLMDDEPFRIGGYSPECYDRKFCGKVTVEESLVYSLNIPTVRLCAEVGADKVREMGRALGIETFLPYEFTPWLGGCEITPMQVAAVYTTIAAGGVYHKPHFITRIEAKEGHILQQHEPSKSEQQVPIVSQRAVTELRRLLQAVVDKGTGGAAQLGRPCAGKTGTSNEHKDLWFAGFTPEISCVVWLGYDDDSPVGGLHPGASHAAPLWKEFMKTVHEGVHVRKFHDTCSDKYGSRASKHFVKRSRRVTRIGLHRTRKSQWAKKETMPWKEVWDWEKASVAWREQEKMADWVAHRTRTATRSTDWARLLLRQP